MSFNLFMTSFFHQWFCHFQSFASLIKLIPKYFILFDVILNGILSLLSPLFSIRNAIDFSVLILYYYFCLIHLLVLTDLCVCVCVCMCVESLGFSTIRSHHLQRLLPFQFGCLFFLSPSCSN